MKNHAYQNAYVHESVQLQLYDICMGKQNLQTCIEIHKTCVNIQQNSRQKETKPLLACRALD